MKSEKSEEKKTCPINFLRDLDDYLLLLFSFFCFFVCVSVLSVLRVCMSKQCKIKFKERRKGVGKDTINIIYALLN